MPLEARTAQPQVLMVNGHKAVPKVSARAVAEFAPADLAMVMIVLRMLRRPQGQLEAQMAKLLALLFNTDWRIDPVIVIHTEIVSQSATGSE